MFHYVHPFIMLKHFKFGKHISIHMSKILKLAHFKISSLDEVFTRPFFFSSSGDEICLCFFDSDEFISARHFTIDRDDFIPGRVSS